MSVLRWEDPPSRDRGGKWAPVAAELRANPGRWACIHEGSDADASSLVQYVKKGDGPFAPAGDFEATSRTIGNGLRVASQIGVYVRFTGPIGGDQS